MYGSSVDCMQTTIVIMSMIAYVCWFGRLNACNVHKKPHNEGIWSQTLTQSRGETDTDISTVRPQTQTRTKAGVQAQTTDGRLQHKNTGTNIIFADRLLLFP